MMECLKKEIKSFTFSVSRYNVVLAPHAVEELEFQIMPLKAGFFYFFIFLFFFFGSFLVLFFLKKSLFKVILPLINPSFSTIVFKLVSFLTFLLFFFLIFYFLFVEQNRKNTIYVLG